MKDGAIENDKIEIFLVEDSPTQAAQLQETLEEHGFTVSVAANGRKALACIREHKPTLVISDIVMPEMDGYQLCREIKTQEATRDLPVILLTRLSDPLDVLRGLECEADYFITKPYDKTSILARIQYILANKTQEETNGAQSVLEVVLAGEKYFIKSDRRQILGLLLSTYEAAIQKNDELEKSQNKLLSFNDLLETEVQARTAALSNEVKNHLQTEEALKESERRNRLLLESVTDYTYTTLMEDGRPVATLHGPGCTNVTGYRPEEYISDPGLWLRIVHTEDLPAALEQARLILEGQMPPSLEHRIIHKHKGIRWIRNTQVPRYSREGKLVACEGVVADITKRKEKEEAIRKGKEEWERTFDAITDPIMILDTGYRITRVNKAMAEKLGIMPDEAVGRTCYSAIHGETEPPPYCLHARLLADCQPFSVEINEPRIGGYYQVNASPLYDSQGKLQGSVHYVRDINERKQMGIQLRQAQKMEAIGTLAGGVAHDFNNILTAIIGFGSLMQVKIEHDNPLADHLAQILAAAGRAAALTGSLLAFSRKQPAEMKLVDLNEVIRGLEKLLQRLIRGDIELRLHLTDRELLALVDAGQIEQMLMNLVTNSCDAMPGGGAVTVATETVDLGPEFEKDHGFGAPGRYALLSFADTGVGMDDQTQQRVFEPFFTTKKVGEGTGLGLAVAYGVIKAHNGYIDCHSEPGHGTTFRIYLPIQQGAVEIAPVSATEQPAGGTETILVAEDDPAVRSLICEILQEFGYTVVEAQDGEEAVAKFKLQQEEISLCLLDVIMPRMKGGAALEGILRIKPDAKAIFMSGYQDDARFLGATTGAKTGVIAKPMMPENLLRSVREMLDK